MDRYFAEMPIIVAFVKTEKLDRLERERELRESSWWSSRCDSVRPLTVDLRSYPGYTHDPLSPGRQERPRRGGDQERVCMNIKGSRQAIAIMEGKNEGPTCLRVEGLEVSKHPMQRASVWTPLSWILYAEMPLNGCFVSLNRLVWTTLSKQIGPCHITLFSAGCRYYSQVAYIKEGLPVDASFGLLISYAHIRPDQDTEITCPKV